MKAAAAGPALRPLRRPHPPWCAGCAPASSPRTAGRTAASWRAAAGTPAGRTTPLGRSAPPPPSPPAPPPLPPCPLQGHRKGWVSCLLPSAFPRWEQSSVPLGAGEPGSSRGRAPYTVLLGGWWSAMTRPVRFPQWWHPAGAAAAGARSVRALGERGETARGRIRGDQQTARRDSAAVGSLLLFAHRSGGRAS